jgi:crotonobetainyl-CoA:carnitine CoA-transferase CaiB-like acyl-CoA transferase
MNAPGPLAGLRILDLTRLLPGGYCTLLLADLGADVVKVEEPGRGDYIRWSPPLVDGVSAAHRALNRGKRSITLNLKAPEAPGVLAMLAEAADVLVESFRPGVMERLGAGHETLADRNPRLVYCAITGYGQDGPYRDRVGHDINYMGYGAGLWLGGPSGGEPTLPGVQVGDVGGGGLMAAVGILAALQERQRTGRGRFVDIAMLDGVVSWLSIHLGNDLAEPGMFDGMRPLSGDLACYRVYRTRDGRHVTVGALEGQFWRALCETLGRPELVEDQFAPPGRQAELVDILQSDFDTKTRDEWLDVFADVQACVGPVNALDETAADPQVRHREMIAEVDGVAVGPASPIKLDGSATVAATAAPELGEHTDEVLAAAGISSDEVSALRAGGVV